MIRFLLVVVAIVTYLSLQSVSAQSIDVDQLTGRMSYTIPIWTSSSRNISFPIALSYSTSGIKVGEGSGNVGMGWYLTDGGSISRIRNGLPDDLNTATKVGWLHGSTASDVTGFTPQADNDYSTSLDEDNDFTALESFGGFNDVDIMKDTEPDIFIVNLPGLSGKFLFDANGNVLTMPYQDITIEKETDGTDKITSFTITTSSGTVYNFQLATGVHLDAESEDETKILFQKNEYYYFKSPVAYNTKWYLTSITSKYGGEIIFNYIQPEYNTGQSTFHVLTFNENRTENTTYHTYHELDEEFVKEVPYYTEIIEDQPYVLESLVGESHTVEIVQGLVPIPGNFGSFPQNIDISALADDTREFLKIRHFNADVPVDLKQPLVQEVRIYEHVVSKKYLLKKFIFDTEYFSSLIAPSGSGVNSSFPFLMSVRESNGTYTAPPIQFKYNGLDLTTKSTTLPWVGSSQMDAYGYFNFSGGSSEFLKLFVYPDLPEAERYRWIPIPDYQGTVYELDGRDAKYDRRGLLSGTLSQVSLPTGGNVAITYEPNYYRDQLTNRNEYGGGLRVNSVRVHDGIDVSHDMVTNYGYEDNSGVSTGKLVNKPVHAYTIGSYINPADDTFNHFHNLTETGVELWEKITLRNTYGHVADPLNYSGDNVMYSQVKTSNPGQGYILNSYAIPVIHSSVSNGDWDVTTTRIARKDLSLANQNYYNFGPIGEAYSYPMAPQTNYDHHRGLLAHSATYNEAGQLLSEVTNTYTYLPTYQTIQGIRRDKIPTLYEYNINITEKDDAETEMYVYNTYNLQVMTYPLLLSSVSTEYDPANYTDSRQTTSSNTYSTTGTPHLLKSSTTNAEGSQYHSYFKYNHDYTVPSGSSSSFVQTLERLNSDGIKGLPIETKSTVHPSGGTEGVVSAQFQEYQFLDNNLSSGANYALRTNTPIGDFSESYINATSKEIEKDSRFEKLGEPISSDRYGNITSVIDRNLNISTTLLSHDGTLPVMSIAGATMEEVGFNNFENDIKIHSSYDDFNFTFSEIGTNLSQYVDGRVKGRGLEFRPGVTNKLVRTITRDSENDEYVISFWSKATTAAAVTIYFDGQVETISIPSSTDWKYNELVFDASSSGNTVLVEITTSAKIPIDDLILAPKDAVFSYPTYGPGLLKHANTNHLGRSSYYEYDDADRVEIVRDFKKNIVQRNKVVIDVVGAGSSNPIITYEDDIFQNTPVEFEALGVRDVNSASFYWVVGQLSNFTGESPEEDESNYSGVSAEFGKNTKDLLFPTGGYFSEDYLVLLKVVTGDGETYYSKVLIDKYKIKPGDITLDVCVQGQLEFDRCGQETGDYYNTCQFSTYTGLAQFKVESTGGSGTITYEWYKSQSPDFLQGSMELVGTGSTYTYPAGGEEITHYIKCIMKADGIGIKGSEPIKITWYQSSISNCNEQ